MIIGIICIEGLYLVTVYRTDKNMITQNKEIIKMTHSKMDDAERQIKAMPEIQKELKLATLRKQDIFSMLPTYQSSSKSVAELLRYMKLNNFEDISIINIEQPENQIQEEGIIQRTYELSFIGCYEEVTNFIHYINQSKQVIYIESLMLNNEIQDLENKGSLVYYNHYGKDFSTLVQVNLILSMYLRYDQGEAKQEIYYPDFDLNINEESLFKYTQSATQVMSIEEDLEQDILTEEIDDLFTLNIGDDHTSGDTYKLDGPGSGEGDYIGLISNENVEIKIEVYTDHYIMHIEDEKGLEEETEVKINLESPRMEVISTRRPISKIMPVIHICIENHTNKVMEVQLVGSMKDNICFFSGTDRIYEGEIKENIRLL